MRFLLFITLLFLGSTLAAQQAEPAVSQSETGIVVRAASQITISGATLLCKGSESELKVEGDYESFLWNNGSTSRFLKIKEEGVYEVTVKTKGGCTLTGSVNVKMITCT